MLHRLERVASLIRQELAMIILKELNDPRLTGLPTITRVKVSPDLSVADVYITVMGTPGHQTAALNALRHSAGMMRGKIAQALSMRITPMLKFHIDEDLKKELEMLDLLEKVARENAELDRKRNGITEVASTTDESQAAETPAEKAVATETPADSDPKQTE
jgi:ribosome-binding factor A